MVIAHANLKGICEKEPIQFSDISLVFESIS